MTLPRFRFSLRTMLVGLSIPCIYLGWTASIVRERRAFEHSVIERGGGFGFYIIGQPKQDVPFLWRAMGVERKASVIMPMTEFSEREISRARVLFPEARIPLIEQPMSRTEDFDMNIPSLDEVLSDDSPAPPPAQP